MNEEPKSDCHKAAVYYPMYYSVCVECGKRCTVDGKWLTNPPEQSNWPDFVEQVRESCHGNYNGGYHDRPENEIFHHGMDTVCNAMKEWGATYCDRIRAEEYERGKADGFKEALKA